MRTVNQLTAALEARFLDSYELVGLPIKTRSKRAKTMVCEALGLPIPKSFQKTSPRFAAENLDVIAQKSNNFQPWNTELDPNRRYAFLILDADDRVRAVKVLMGAQLMVYNTTGTLTSKFQAAFADYAKEGCRPHGDDTAFVKELIAKPRIQGDSRDPCAPPDGALLPLAKLAKRLAFLLGTELKDPGADQERLRGQELHQDVGKALGYGEHRDSGQHPDVPHQLLELKLQTSPTVDLGLVDPASTAALSPPFPDGLRHADTRYAVFGGVRSGPSRLRLIGLTVVAGERFFEVFRRFGGLGKNSKLQIRLPTEWWG